MNVACDPITQSQAKMLQGAINRGLEKEADELAFYVALKRGIQVVQNPGLINSVVITPMGYNCNLSCDYCFNGPEKSLHPKVMSEEVLDKLIHEVINISPNIEFIWHGGEPLLAGIEFYQRVLDLQQKYGLSRAERRNAVQTNGTLLDENWSFFFKENDFKVGISLDGPKRIHDLQRKYPSNQGSYDDASKAIECLDKYQKAFGIIAIINEMNLCAPDKFLDFFIRNKLFHFNVNPCLNRSSLPAQTYADFMCCLFDAWLDSDVPEFRIGFFEGLIQIFLGLPSNICWFNGNCPKIIGIDQTGDVWPCCDRYLPFEQYKLGNIFQTSLMRILDDPTYRSFKDTFSQLPSRCMSCEFNHACKGGCAYHRLINGRGKDSPDPLCSAYKQIFRHVFAKCREINGRIATSRRFSANHRQDV